MKTRLLLLAGLFFIFPSGQAQQKGNAKVLDAMTTQGMKDWQIPGLATVVVKNGEVVFKKAYGFKQLDNQAPVDEHTLFNMASTTKAIVCQALGILVDQGKLNWTDKVRDHLPYFKLSDSYLTEEARVQDLLTHNLGIQQADLLWALDSTSTKETIERFALSKKTYPVRGGFDYNNVMYAIAGEVIQAVSGQHWTDFVKENIFKPVGMADAEAKASEIFKKGNYTTPYLNDLDDGIVQVDYNLSDQIGAAGMIWASLSDVTNYLQYLVNDGVVGKDTILSRSTFDYLFKPHAFVTDAMFYPTQQLTHPHWKTYGLGWFQHDYRGEKLDFHTGSIGGLIAICGIMRDKDVAVYVFANLDHAELRHAILYKAMDLFAFDDNSRDWHKEVFQLYSKFKEQEKQYYEKLRNDRVKGTSTTLPLEAYEGEYTHAMLGTAKVTKSDNGLDIDFNNFLNVPTYHWQYNTFMSTKENPYRAEIDFNFQIGSDGKVSSFDAFGETFEKKN
ncbi:serine hydrolase [Flagellimonas aequoris]|uniref:Serine hydrolase n=1 Tax=Flagellimonas aequoris TaxID=2306997 RepID=A0A418NB26_9FLAO|nr:serine hydrolase [Allomuricauda aequoris]RIV73764.1 serine hydrolase [Allomuricauda aequoris]TXK07448.1 serine hydrolase [Allomuricauda aequoris]